MKFKLAIGIFVITICIGGALFFIGTRTHVSADERLIHPSVVYARSNGGCYVYGKKDGEVVDILEDNTKVEIIKDVSTQWYYIRYGNSLGWVKSSGLDIPKDTKADKSRLKTSELEQYANSHFENTKGHCILVDIGRQLTYVFKSDGENWQLEKQLVCSTGRNISPTIRGRFKIEDRGEWFYSDRLKSGAKYWLRFKNSYLFHSVAMDKNQNITDNTLGEKSSNGCVRLAVEDAKWMYENVENGSDVFIY